MPDPRPAPVEEGSTESPEKTSRRRFMKLAALGGGAVTVSLLGGKLLMEWLDRAPSDVTRSPDKVRRWVMVIDLRRCDGCGKCTEGCALEHNVPNPQEWIKVYKEEDNGGKFYLPRPCMHCENPPCVKVCPVGATFRSKDSLILIDEDRCIGCRYCMAACPYDARYFNWGEPPEPQEDSKLSPTALRGHKHHKRGVVEKCTFCAHRLDEGRLPACVEACTEEMGNGAIYFGDANEDFVSNGREVLQLSKILRTTQTFRWKEDLGTKPNVIYLPVRR